MATITNNTKVLGEGKFEMIIYKMRGGGKKADVSREFGLLNCTQQTIWKKKQNQIY